MVSFGEQISDCHKAVVNDSEARDVDVNNVEKNRLKSGLAMPLVARMAGLSAVVSRWRVPLGLVAAIVFIVGLGISIRALDLRWEEVALEKVLLLLAFLSPASLALAAVSLQLTAQVVGRTISFREACIVSAIGRIAEILPLPGGAIVRGGALMRAGAGLTESTWIVSLTAVMTLFMTATVASLPIILAGQRAGFALLLIGLGGAAASVWWIIRSAGVRLAMAMIGLRIAIIGFGAAHIYVAFAAISVGIGIIDAGLFVISMSLGSSIAIVPAGLGLSESIAAALATFVQLSPAAAFLAVAMTRLSSLTVSGTIVLLATVRRKHTELGPKSSTE